MSDKMKVDIEGIREIAQNINLKRDEIKNIYETKIMPVLNSSSECLKVSGLKYEEVKQTYDKVFNSLYDELSELTEALTNKIIPSYQESSNVIKRIFNTDFAQRLSELLSVLNK